jgi:hypothetical protein
MNNQNFIPVRKVFSYKQTINAEPETIFPLLCPVREAEWLEGWTYKMIYSSSGIAEKGAIFSTSNVGEENTIWIITRHDKEENIVEFARFTPNNRTCELEIKIEKVSGKRSFVYIVYTYTGLTEVGNEYIINYTIENFNNSMKHWENSMNYFTETGEMLVKGN